MVIGLFDVVKPLFWHTIFLIFFHPGTLQTSRDPSIYAAGDCASLLMDGFERSLPPTARVAHQQAQHLIAHLPAALCGKPIPPFQQRDFGSLVSLHRTAQRTSTVSHHIHMTNIMYQQ